jgi:hypothetical protein
MIKKGMYMENKKNEYLWIDIALNYKQQLPGLMVVMQFHLLEEFNIPDLCEKKYASVLLNDQSDYIAILYDAGSEYIMECFEQNILEEEYPVIKKYKVESSDFKNAKVIAYNMVERNTKIISNIDFWIDFLCDD